LLQEPLGEIHGCPACQLESGPCTGLVYALSVAEPKFVRTLGESEVEASSWERKTLDTRIIRLENESKAPALLFGDGRGRR